VRGDVSYTEAAQRVLAKHSRGAPLHYRRITGLAIAEGLVTPGGVTPEATMNAAITQDIKKRDAASRSQQFRAVGRGLYALAIPTDPLGGSIDRHNREVRTRLRDALAQMDPRAFEHLIGLLLTSIEHPPLLRTPALRW
jgi:HB1, ASXL, restriction endonuclease HTH domain